MARTEDVLTIFLASPGDVTDERNRFEEAVQDWNKAWARSLGLRLEVLRWEDDAFPGIGEDAQDVINRQVPGDYDLFVGLMWSRFGTPTGRSGSGTAEEFERALGKYKAAPDSVAIFFYFKDQPVPPSKIDPAQLQRLQEFKSTLQRQGVLYWEFSDADQFEKLVGLHITRHVQEWRLRRDERQRKAVPAPGHLPQQAASQEPIVPISSDEDAGYLDFLETFTERVAEVSEISTRLTEAQSELSARTVQRTAELQALAASPNSATPTQAKRLIAKAADDMLQYSNRVEAEIPLFRAAIDGGISALTNAVTIFPEADREQVQATKSAAVVLLAALSTARASVIKFRASTSALPRMTKELNAAKRKQTAALDGLVGEFENGERLLVVALTVLDTLLKG